jgi:hypothetical protein
MEKKTKKGDKNVQSEPEGAILKWLEDGRH